MQYGFGTDTDKMSRTDLELGAVHTGKCSICQNEYNHQWSTQLVTWTEKDKAKFFPVPLAQ